MDIHPPDSRRRDLDNVQKALLDALGRGGAYLDDSQIVRLVAEKRAVVPGGKAIVRIEEFNQPCQPACRAVPASSTLAQTRKS